MLCDKKSLQNIFKILLILSLLFTFCKNDQNVTVTDEVSKPDSTTTNVQQIMLEGQSEFEDSVKSLMELIKEKEEELKKAEFELKQKSAELIEKEIQLEQIEAELKNFRTISIIILAIGLILIIIGLFLVFLRRESAKNTANFNKTSEKLTAGLPNKNNNVQTGSSPNIKDN